MSRLTKLLNRPPYLPPPTREELMGEALAELHRKLAPFCKPRPKDTTHAGK